MKAVNITRYGGRMKYSEIPMPQLQHGQVLIKMAYAPINPSDVYFAKGVYGIKKQLPSIIGFEGSGQIIDASTDNKTQILNKYVACWANESIQSGTWSQYLVTDENSIIQLDQESQLKDFNSPMINPGTVLGFYSRVKSIGSEYVVINASFSQLGQMVVKYFSQNGLKPICLVRKNDQIEQLYKFGADKVFLQDSIDEIQEYTKQTQASVFLDAVGGPPAANVFTVMPKKTVMISYGAFELKKMELDSQLFIFQQKQIEGFWLTRYFESLDKQQLQQQYREIYDNILNGNFSTSIYKQYPIEQFQRAVLESFKISSQGKNLLKIE